MFSSIPRRARIDFLTQEELAIYNLSGEIEKLGAHPLLTEVVVLLGQARGKLADWVELSSRPTPAEADLAATLAHIKEWVSQDQSGQSVDDICRAIVRMCDDGLGGQAA